MSEINARSVRLRPCCFLLVRFDSRRVVMRARIRELQLLRGLRCLPLLTMLLRGYIESIVERRASHCREFPKVRDGSWTQCRGCSCCHCGLFCCCCLLLCERCCRRQAVRSRSSRIPSLQLRLLQLELRTRLCMWLLRLQLLRVLLRSLLRLRMLLRLCRQ